MNRTQPIAIRFTQSRWGRAALHAMCMARDRQVRWHLRGIVRELFNPCTVSSGACDPVRRTPAGRAIDSWRTKSSRHNTTICALILLCALSGGRLRVFAFPGAAALELLPAATVDGTGIHLQQLVANSSVLPPQPIRLAIAPAFGQAASLSREQIQAALQSVAPEWRVTNWLGAAQVRITRRARSFTESELRELITATLQQDFIKDRGELELRLSRPWAAVRVPDESLVLKIIDVPAAGVTPNFIVRFELVAGQERFGPWQAVVQAKVMRDLLIARETLKRGQPMQGSDFTAERRDILTLREPLTSLPNTSFDLIENVSAGQPLLARAVRMRPMVSRGQFVDGLVLDGSLQISLKVEVLGDGLPGQTVRVRNPKTNREFHAKVQDEQTVVIRL